MSKTGARRFNTFPLLAILLTSPHLGHAKAHHTPCPPGPAELIQNVKNLWHQTEVAAAGAASSSIFLGGFSTPVLLTTGACGRVKPPSNRFQPELMSGAQLNAELTTLNQRMLECQTIAAKAGVDALLGDLKMFLDVGKFVGAIVYEAAGDSVPSWVFNIPGGNGGDALAALKDNIKGLDAQLRSELNSFEEALKTTPPGPIADRRKKRIAAIKKDLANLEQKLKPVKTMLTKIAKDYYKGDVMAAAQGVYSGEVMEKVAQGRLKSIADKYYDGNVKLAANEIMSGQIYNKLMNSAVQGMVQLHHTLADKWDEFKCTLPSVQAEIVCRAVGVVGYQAVTAVVGLEELTLLAKAAKGAKAVEGAESIASKVMNSKLGTQFFAALAGKSAKFHYVEVITDNTARLAREFKWLELVASNNDGFRVARARGGVGGAAEEFMLEKAGKYYKVTDPEIHAELARKFELQEIAQGKHPDAPQGDRKLAEKAEADAAVKVDAEAKAATADSDPSKTKGAKKAAAKKSHEAPDEIRASKEKRVAVATERAETSKPPKSNRSRGPPDEGQGAKGKSKARDEGNPDAPKADAGPAHEVALAAAPPLDTGKIRQRVADAIKNRAPELYLPELLVETRWAEGSIDGILDAVKKGTSLTKAEAQALDTAAEELRQALKAISKHPEGVPALEWEWLSGIYADFAELNSAGMSMQRFGGMIEDSSKRVSALLKDGFKETAQSRVARLAKYDQDWLPYYSARPVDITTMNQWMADGIVPIGVTDKPLKYDGLSSPQGAKAFRRHDLNHFESLGDYKTGSKLSPKEYFDRFRKFQSNVGADEMMKKNLEVTWFYAYHERIGDTFGPNTLNNLLMPLPDQREKLARTLLNRIKKEHDLGDIYGGKLPSEDELLAAFTKLWDFASEARTAGL